MNRRPLLALAGLALACGVAHADEETGWYLTPIGGYLITDSDRRLDDDWIYGLAFGRRMNQAWAFELGALTSDHSGNSSPDVRMTQYTLDALRFFGDNPVFTPYLSAGAGVLDVDRDFSPARKDFMLQAGIGALWRIAQSSPGTTSLHLRPEAKVRWDDAGGNGHPVDYWVGLGLQLVFGKSGSVSSRISDIPAQPPPPPPPPPPVAAPPAPPADSDADGVPDARDRCAGTPRGVSVDVEGCTRAGSITLYGVGFENDSAVLVIESREVLERVATELKAFPRLRVELQGHTDSAGAASYNLNLSQQRANAVREFLIGRGVPPAQMVAKGYGEGAPVADNATAEGRAQNRRVVLQILENPGNVEVKPTPAR